MARLADKTSVRQRVFAKLDNLSHLKRMEAVNVVVEELAISESYARTLYQNHRKLRSETTSDGDDGFVTIFKVRDTRSNSPVDPYMSRMVRNNPKPSDPRTKKEAISVYRKDNIRKNKLAVILV